MDPGIRRSLALAAALAAVFLSSCTDESNDSDVVSATDGRTTEADRVAGGDPPASEGTEVTSTTEEPTGEATIEDPSQTASPPTVIAGVAPSASPEVLASEEADAASLIEPVLAVGSEALRTPEVIDEDSIVTVAEGSALDAIKASAAEFAANGWTQHGAPVLVSAEVTSVDPEADPPQAVVAACLDHGDVDIVDASGESIVDPEARTRVLNTFVMTYVDGRWVLVERSFPDDPSC